MTKEKEPAASSPANQPSSAPPVPDKLAADLHVPIIPDSQDDSEIDKAVDDIATKEADQVLAAEDAEVAKAFEKTDQPKGLKAKIVNFLKAWWNNPKARYGTIAGLLVVVIAALAIPPSRYFVLNTVGIRSSASVTVIDQSTQQPLKNVNVQVANQTTTTDSNGVAKLTKVKLGATQLTISRRAFASVSKKVTVGWGSNPYGNFAIKPTGSQYDFIVTDFMSNKGINKAEATAGDAVAAADEQGILVLTVEPNQDSPLEVVVKADGYREEKVSLNLDDKNQQAVKLVPDRKHVYASKRSGKFDLYSADLDGKNEKVLLAGSGLERSDILVVPNPAAHKVALSSSRENSRNKDGYLLTTLNIIDSDSGEKTQIAQSESIQVIDWIGDRLIFVQVAAGASASNPNRQRLVSYDTASKTQKELASSNYFNGAISAGGVIYYAPSDATNAGFYKINADGSSKANLQNKPTWSIIRSQYDQLSLVVGADWYSYKLGDVTTTKLGGPPSSQQNRIYNDNSNRKQSLWVEKRDGKGVLLNYSTSDKKDTILKTLSGLTNPVYWLNDQYVIYRVQTDQETADYALNINGGEPRKLSDVTGTNGGGGLYDY
ncbi:MAG: hypothetical protein QG553_307 [Patescibacteria group bacterium]|nr:hypothetical protein [Patescibacteria group bacterium]